MIFETICRKNGLDLSASQLELLDKYVELLLEWNSKVNLISRAGVENVWFNHILHSLSMFFFVNFREKSKVLDLGTGGGLPGIPMSIVRPDLRVVLLDSIRKKTAAVQNIIDCLQLSAVRVVTGRAEDIAKEKEFSQAFDMVITRAVAPLGELIKWSRRLTKASDKTPWATISDNKVLNGPCLLSLKGGDLTSELETARIKSRLKTWIQINVVFDGSEELGFQEKKIIIVPF